MFSCPLHISLQHKSLVFDLFLCHCYVQLYRKNRDKNEQSNISKKAYQEHLAMINPENASSASGSQGRRSKDRPKKSKKDQVCDKWAAEGCIRGFECMFQHPIPENSVDPFLVKILETQQTCLFHMMNSLKELARRQEEMDKRIKELQSRTPTPKSRQRHRSMSRSVSANSVTTELDKLN